MKNRKANGAGCCVPPEKQHVIIYFSEKGFSEEAALRFFNGLASRKWRNHKGLLIKNWKEHAWNLLYYKLPCQD